MLTHTPTPTQTPTPVPTPTAGTISIDLSAERILVTGALGGIGVVVIERLIDAGASVIASDVIPTEQAHAALAAWPPERIGYAYCDVSDEASVDTLFETLTADGRPPTTVVSLAGVVEPGMLHEQTVAGFDHVAGVNIRGAFLIARASVRAWLRTTDHGHLVFVGSWVQNVPWPGIGPYGASKAAVQALARTTAREYAGIGIRANIVAPGIVDVGMAHRQWLDDPVYRRRAQRAIPMGRLQSPASVADAIVFICSPMASYMTGATLLVDGGASLYPLDPGDVNDQLSG
jgi:NAD(P)-dependent dehydrogenase (short-subunit alcohol dehydrogenase family)